MPFRLLVDLVEPRSFAPILRARRAVHDRVDDATWRAWSALPGDAFELVIVQPFVLVRPMSGAEAP